MPKIVEEWKGANSQVDAKRLHIVICSLLIAYLCKFKFYVLFFKLEPPR